MGEIAGEEAKLVGATGFELKNLTPGQYKVTAWHEKLGTVEQKLIIGAKETKNIGLRFQAPSFLRGSFIAVAPAVEIDDD